MFRVGRYAGLFTASTVFHAGVAVVVSIVEPPAVVETVRFRLTEPPPAPPQEAEPPPPPPTPPPVAPAPVRTPQRRAETPPPAPVEAPAAPAPSFGVRMQGGVGQGGVALPAGDSLATPPVTRTAQARALEAPAEERGDAAAECPEEPTRPRPIDIPQPAYTVEARTAGIEGRVRARISVDETGAVTNVAVIEGLGHGLDEAALAALRTARFEPATRCGRPVADTLTISVRFTL